MKHKIRVWKPRRPTHWYVECLCGWEPAPSSVTGLFGRPTWDAAFAVGVAHQKNADVVVFRDDRGRFKSPRKSHNVHECDSRCW